MTSGMTQADNAKQTEGCEAKLGSKVGKYSKTRLDCQKRGVEIFPPHGWLCECYFW